MEFSTLVPLALTGITFSLMLRIIQTAKGIRKLVLIQQAARFRGLNLSTARTQLLKDASEAKIDVFIWLVMISKTYALWGLLYYGAIKNIQLIPQQNIPLLHAAFILLGAFYTINFVFDLWVGTQLRTERREVMSSEAPTTPIPEERVASPGRSAGLRIVRSNLE